MWIRDSLWHEPACHVAKLPAAKRSFTTSILRLILIRYHPIIFQIQPIDYITRLGCDLPLFEVSVTQSGLNIAVSKNFLNFIHGFIVVLTVIFIRLSSYLTYHNETEFSLDSW